MEPRTYCAIKNYHEHGLIADDLCGERRRGWIRLADKYNLTLGRLYRDGKPVVQNTEAELLALWNEYHS